MTVCYDLRAEQTDPPKVRGKFKLSAGKVVRRPWAQITGVVIHQTACVFGVTPAALIAAGGDKALAKARRSLGVACHGLAFADGFYAVPNPLEWYVYHGNGFNGHTLGLEIEGIYPGLRDNPATPVREDVKTTWGGKPMELSAFTVAAACACLQRIVTDARAAGAPIQYVYAHRQSSATRRSDPGEAIWRSVVLDYAVPHLGLTAVPQTVLGDGRPVPVEWAPDGVGGY